MVSGGRVARAAGRARRRGASGVAGVLAAVGALGVLASARVTGGEAGSQVSGVRCLRVDYKTTGVLPGESGTGGKRSGLQWITMAEDGSRLILEEVQASGAPGPEPGEEPSVLVPVRKFILRMDRTPPVIYEVFDQGRKYRERSGDMNDLQTDRRITEQAMVKAARDLPAREREEFLRRNYLKVDGTRDVVVTADPGKELLGKKCVHVVITENGRTIIDAQVTREAPGARSYYQLYRWLGAFSQEVLEKLSRLDGFPLEARITVVTALPAYEFSLEVTKMTPVELDAAAFEVPSGAVKVEDDPAEAVCHTCGKAIEDPKNPPYRGPVEGKIGYFCSDRCFEDFERKRGIKKGRPAPAPGAVKAAPEPGGAR